jgi:two-component system alkaline phosphatase synthesis response regulator PhoP
MSAIPYKVLIVEDDDLVLELIKTAFDAEKNHLYTAGTLDEAEKLLKQNGADILILDRMLPDGDGLQLCSKLRNTPQFKALPVLILTGRADTSDKVLGLNLGADDYLTKPFSLDELKARVNSLLRRSEELSQASYIKRRLWRY